MTGSYSAGDFCPSWAHECPIRKYAAKSKLSPINQGHTLRETIQDAMGVRAESKRIWIAEPSLIKGQAESRRQPDGA